MTRPGNYAPDYTNRSSPVSSVSTSSSCSGSGKDDRRKIAVPPVIEGIGSSAKPTYSYASLIGLAIMNSEDHRARLSSIYNWISTNFSYYQLDHGGWQNSIRHNLTVNKCFVKDMRKNDPPGKGSFWAIHSEFKRYFENGYFERPKAEDDTAVSAGGRISSPLPRIKRRYSSNSIPRKSAVPSRQRRLSESRPIAPVIIPRIVSSDRDDHNMDDFSTASSSPISDSEESSEVNSQVELSASSPQPTTVASKEDPSFFSIFANLSNFSANSSTAGSNRNSVDNLASPNNNRTGTATGHHSIMLPYTDFVGDTILDPELGGVDFYGHNKTIFARDISEVSAAGIDAMLELSCSNHSLAGTGGNSGSRSSEDLTSMLTDSTGSLNGSAPSLIGMNDGSHQHQHHRHDNHHIMSCPRIFEVSANPFCQHATTTLSNNDYLKRSVLLNTMNCPELADLFLGYDDSVLMNID
eukprot:Partr_v1_DN26517_c1_g1_i1_m3378 putative Forkhead transcription factor